MWRSIRTAARFGDPDSLLGGHVHREIVGVKIRGTRQSIPIGNANDGPGGRLYQPMRSKSLERAVDVHGGEPGCIRQLRLCHRKIKNDVACASSRPRDANAHFTKQVRDPLL